VSTRRYCTFHVGGLLIGVPIERVDEVLRGQSILPVPLAHPDVVGLANLRGRIVTVLDARGRLGLTGDAAEARPTIVMIHSAAESVGLLLDREGDVVDVDDDHLVAVPRTVGARICTLTVGAYQLDASLLLLLDPDGTISVTS
jgi:purine-binding chemotaxis protein CheW